MDSVSSDGKAKNTCQIGSGKNMPNVEQLLIKMTETINTIRKKMQINLPYNLRFK
jgi:hypothetical protein